MNSRKIYTAVIVIILCLRVWGIASVHQDREMPIEVDDALSYILHSAILDKDPTYESPMLQSFGELEIRMPQVTLEDFYRHRIQHRLKEFYHSGQAIIIYLTHKVTGVDYLPIWWSYIYLFNILLILLGGALIVRLAGYEVASAAMALYGFSFLLVPHQWTGAPREWCNLGFIGSMLYYLRLREKLTSLRPWEWLCFISLLFVCFNSHRVGWLLTGQVIGFEFLMRLMNRNWRASYRAPLIFASLTLGVFLVQFLFLKLYGVPSYQTTPMEWASDVNLWLRLKNFVYEPAKAMVKLTPFGYGGVLVRMLGAGLISIFFIISFLEFLTKQSNAKNIIALFLASLPVYIAFHLFGMDYRPATRYYFYYSYVHTSFLLILTIFVSFGFLKSIKYIFPKNEKIRLFAPLALVFVLLGSHWGQTQASIQNFSNRHQMTSPQNTIEEWEIQSTDNNKCIVVKGEVLLYALIIWGDLNRSVSYNHLCQTTSNWTNSVPHQDCKYVSFQKGTDCPMNHEIEIVAQDRSYVFGKVVSNN